jgi:amino acid transporter
VIFWSSIVLIFNGWETFTKGNWDPANFVIAYVTVPIFVILTAGFIVVKKPKFVKAEDLDLYSNIPSDEEVSYTEPVPKTWFGRTVNFIFT